MFTSVVNFQLTGTVPQMVFCYLSRSFWKWPNLSCWQLQLPTISKKGELKKEHKVIETRKKPVSYQIEKIFRLINVGQAPMFYCFHCVLLVESANFKKTHLWCVDYGYRNLAICLNINANSLFNKIVYFCNYKSHSLKERKGIVHAPENGLKTRIEITGKLTERPEKFKNTGDIHSFTCIA